MLQMVRLNAIDNLALTDVAQFIAGLRAVNKGDALSFYVAHDVVENLAPAVWSTIKPLLRHFTNTGLRISVTNVSDVVSQVTDAAAGVNFKTIKFANIPTEWPDLLAKRTEMFVIDGCTIYYRQ